ncbi:phosphate acetyltransferase [Lottiidibacillus patelloidae]|uniref:Phosphate acetyltransferase n=1 Tax=Lottiidibacillus patelloidae TaxID=2670334 RepID=A0A263BSN7_9BACI|nr:phosphate acetyltransferase [Lottiidibacillus patelloidae]OZM56724.1 phosphate acetyltransferase [Lottiidibacillus patelloidae]
MFKELKETVKAAYPTIVFPEGTDVRILEAAGRLSTDEIIKPILIGDKQEINKLIEQHNISFKDVEVIQPDLFEDFSQLVVAFVERRKGKATEEDARKILLDENYFGTMLVYTNKADGLVSGAAHSTADTVRPALQIIKTKEGFRRTSGAFIMVREEEKYMFADCAINISPDANDLAEIAIATAETAKAFNLDPNVAMLSFSTKGSAKSPETEKVIEATRIAKERDPQLFIDGEFQFDAAFVPEVAAKKAPDSPLAGKANVFVFPSLEAGNIGYKIAQRLGGFEAIGPILQGLNKPVNDLSRGCNVEDVYKLALITAAQSL